MLDPVLLSENVGDSGCVLSVVNDAESDRTVTLKKKTEGEKNGLDTTFQLDEDAVQNLAASSSDPTVLRTKKRRSRRKRLSESLSQPRFADNYRCTGDAFLGCGSYGSVYTCSSLKSSEHKSSGKQRASSQSERSKTVVGINSDLSRMHESVGAGGGSRASLLCELEAEREEEFAVKIIDKKGHSRTRLFNEMEILHQCKNHPNIVQLLDFYEEDQMFYLIFEKMNGGPLLDHMSRDGAIGERDASLVTRDISTALSFLHAKGIAHRDLKPANILCVNEHSIAPVKICDFDLASAPWTRENDVTSLANFSADSVDLLSPVGSAEYMAPEVVSVFLGGSLAAAYDKRCDLWSLGVILYIMLCGYPPFVGRCGYPCGWDEGNSCSECQSLLMEAIQEGELQFPASEWDFVSDEAKSLVCSLLERDISKRITADRVLKHDWLMRASAVASEPIPLNTSRIRKSSAATSQYADQLITKYRNYPQRGNAVPTDTEDFSPEERQRLGTEDSGFGGDNVSGVVGLLLDAATDNESNVCTKYPGTGGKLKDQRGGEDENGNLACGFEKGQMIPGIGDHQFELSDDESLFSSGYGMSLDLPSVEIVSVHDPDRRPSDESDFGFESVNKTEIELEMKQKLSLTEVPIECKVAGLLATLGLRSNPSSRKSSNTTLKSGQANGFVNGLESVGNGVQEPALDEVMERTCLHDNVTETKATERLQQETSSP